MTTPSAVLHALNESIGIALRDYPFTTVRVVCHRCERQERFRRERLLEEHGPGITMRDLREQIVICHERHRPGQSCRAYYPDLTRD
jgi:hypothetical protein